MVSESEYDANQKKFKEAAALQPTAGPSTGTGIPGRTDPLSAATGTNPQGLTDPTGQAIIDTIVAGGLTAGVGGALGAAGIGGGMMTGATGTGAGVGTKVLGSLKARSIGVLLAPIIAFFAGSSGIVNSVIGKEWNKFASDNNLSAGNLKLAAFEKMYTEPVEVGGKWVFLFSDAVLLDERMREAGVDRSLIPGRIQQLNQLRQANVELIASAGEPVDFESQQIP